MIVVLTSIMIMAASMFCFAEGGFDLVRSYPENGQKNTSIENLGVKLQFSKPLDKMKDANADKLAIYDEDGKAIPVKILFSDKEEGLVLVLADVDNTDRNSTVRIKNNSEYKLVVSGELVDNDGEALGEDKTVTFTTYNQRVNNMVNMVMMFVMFGGIMFLSLRQNQEKEEEVQPKDAPKKQPFNPYKEAQKTGKTVEEVMAEQAKKEEKEAKKKARKKKDTQAAAEKKIDNCAELLTNVYHVHAPAPVNKEDRSIEALKALRKAEKNSSKKKSTKKK